MRNMTRPALTRRTLLAAGLVAILAATASAQSRLIFKQKSPFVTIGVYDVEGYRQLIFDNTAGIQSEVNLRDPDELALSYTRHFMAGLPLAEKLERILMVGLGGGTMQRYVHTLLPDVQIDTAEIDPLMPDVAKRFFFFEEDAKNKVYVMDGRKFIEQTGDPYDIIFLDAYGPDLIPYPLTTQEFMKAVGKRLTPKGVVVANLWYDESKYYDMLKTYQSVFAEIHVLRCAHSGNRIVVGFQEKIDLDAAKWIAGAKEFEKAHPTRLNLPSLIDRGFESETRIPDRAKILLDADIRDDSRIRGRERSMISEKAVSPGA
jgi:spermidine synthase